MNMQDQYDYQQLEPKRFSFLAAFLSTILGALVAALIVTGGDLLSKAESIFEPEIKQSTQVLQEKELEAWAQENGMDMNIITWPGYQVSYVTVEEIQTEP